MAASSTISSKGQITVPLEIRERLGLRVGDRVEFVVEYGQTVLRPSRSPENAFERYIGSLPAFQNEPQIRSWIAGLRDDGEDG
jgi:antitoxin PrlF